MRRHELRDVKTDELRPNERNPRRISETRFLELRRSIAQNPEHLRARPIVSTWDGVIVAGEMRWRAAVAEGLETVPNFRVELEPDAATAWLLRDNNEYGEWVEQELAEILYDLEQAGADLELTGFDRDETTRLIDSVAGTKPPHNWPDEPAPEPPDKPRSRTGQVYKLGAHRLMCGDSTNPKHVARLFDGAEPTLIVTDPPYGVDLELGWRRGEERHGPGHETKTTTPAGYPALQGRHDPGGRKGPAGRTPRTNPGNTSMPGDKRHEWSAAYELVPSAVALYTWFADVYVAEIVTGLRRVGFELSQLIVWDKMAFALSRAHYHWRHELGAYALRANVDTEIPWYGPVADLALYAKRKGSKVPFLGARDQPTIWSAPSPKRAGARDSSDEPADHPTQKPTLLWTRPFLNHTRRGEPVYDPFGGSGTAIIAAEVAGRAGLAMELDPRFCDVTRQRYAEFTGGSW